MRTTKPELYDLQADPAELENLAADRPELVSEMDDELALFFEGLKPRSGDRQTLSDRELRSLESLGYVGGSALDPEQVAFDQQGPDIKDMIVHLNTLFDAKKLIEHHEYSQAVELLQPLAETVPNFSPRSLLAGRVPVPARSVGRRGHVVRIRLGDRSRLCTRP